jgi:hypothetical protein
MERSALFIVFFLVLLVNDSEYSKTTDAKSILSPCCIYRVSPGARAPTPPRPPFLGGEGSTKKTKSPVASALPVRHVGVCVGVMEVAMQCKNHTSEV